MYKNIQAMRGLAATMVVTGHALGMSADLGMGTAPANKLFFCIYGSGVDIFFVISGFIIANSIVAAARQGGRLTAAGQFAFRRVVRIYPIYWLVLACTLAFFILIDAPQKIGVAQIFLTTYATPLAPPAWSLYCEVAFYAIATLLLLVAPRRLFAATAIVMALFLGLRLSGQFPGVFLLQQFMFEFGFGVVIAYIARRGISRFALPLGVLALIPFAMGFWLMAERTVPAMFDYERLATYGAGAALLIYAAVAAEARGMRLPRPMQWLGDISYSTYVWHWLVLTMLTRARLPHIGGYGHVALWVAAILGVAMLSYRYLERPSLRFAHNAWPSLKAVPVPAIPANAL